MIDGAETYLSCIRRNIVLLAAQIDDLPLSAAATLFEGEERGGYPSPWPGRWQQ